MKIVMIDAPGDAAHLSDADIDAYWKGTLSADVETRVEQHYLECADCRTRVRLVEMLIDGLASAPPAMSRASTKLRAWQVTAAACGAIAVLTTWQWANSVRAVRQPAEAGEATSLAATQSVAELNTIVVPLAPPTRDAHPVTVMLAANASVVVFEIDAREAAAPGSRFDVSLARPGGETALRLGQISSTTAGMVRVPVERSVLGTGTFVFGLTAGSTTIAVPVLIDQGASR